MKSGQPEARADDPRIIWICHDAAYASQQV
jgi:hypothetical protein